MVKFNNKIIVMYYNKSGITTVSHLLSLSLSFSLITDLMIKAATK